MKCVGIIGAMEQEVARLKEVMEDVSITTRANMDFYEGVLEGNLCASGSNGNNRPLFNGDRIL